MTSNKGQWNCAFLFVGAHIVRPSFYTILSGLNELSVQQCYNLLWQLFFNLSCRIKCSSLRSVYFPTRIDCGENSTKVCVVVTNTPRFARYICYEVTFILRDRNRRNSHWGGSAACIWNASVALSDSDVNCALLIAALFALLLQYVAP